MFTSITQRVFTASLLAMTMLAAGTASAADWGTCRDACYEQRNRCFSVGGETEICERHYDRCAASCDSRY